MLDHEGGMRVAALSDKHCKKVLFTGSLHSMTTFHDVPAYSDIYGCHPSRIAATSDGWTFVSSRADPYTAKLGDVMRSRQDKRSINIDADHIHKYRQMVMDNQALQFTNKLGQMLDDMCMVNVKTRAGKQLTFQLHNNGQSDARAQLFPDKADTSFVSSRHAPELPCPSATGQSTTRDTYDRLCAARTKSIKQKGPARQGAKKAKMMERLQSAGHVLDPDEATSYRALSARCNVIAQDLNTIYYVRKELCREFAAPTHDSFARLNRGAS